MLQPHEGPSETGSDVLDSGGSFVLQPHEGPSETRESPEEPARESLQPHEGPSETDVGNLVACLTTGFNPTRDRLKLVDLVEGRPEGAASTPRGTV